MFSILVVCTGNLCRSPIAAQLLSARLDGRAFEVDSAGVRAVAGGVMPPEAIAQSVRYGGEPNGHRARQLTATHVAAADLVLTAQTTHRASVLELYPAALSRTFTLRQFARLTLHLSDDELAMLAPAAVVSAVGAQRGVHAPAGKDDDIADPYRGTEAQYETAGRAIAESVEQVARAFGWRRR